MDVQLRDEAAQDRVRAATEFLDPGKCCDRCGQQKLANMAFFLRRCPGTQVRPFDFLFAVMALTG